jgi:GDP-mannose 6-dehydrogenase
VAELYGSLSAPIHRVSPETAEMLKLVCNAFHAMKVGFANEVSRFCDPLDVDARTVMELLCADTKLNISPLYLKPGFAFGGSCLPKDLRSLLYQAVRLGAELPILEGVLRSNQVHIDWVRVRVHEIGAERVAILGLSFKAGTDDLRESPVLHLIRQLWQDGIDVLVHDPDVVPEEMLGANREYLERQLPQIREILRPRLEDALRDRDLVLITQDRPAFREAVEARELPAVMDLTTSASRFLHSMASR